MLKTCFIIISIIILYQYSYAQAIKSLQVGDKVPDVEIEKIINFSIDHMALHDIKKPLVLIDFWGATCTSCIAFLPKLDSLQHVFKKDLQVFTVTDFDTKAKVERTLDQLLKSKRKITLPVVLNGEKLKKYFPHELISHIVWIRNGEVFAITGTEYVNADNIRLALEGKKVDWPMKNDLIGFDYNKPLLSFKSGTSIQPKSVFYSAFTGAIPGIDSKTGVYVDSVAQTITFTFYNSALLSYCAGAVDGTALTYPDRKQVVWEVKDKSRFFFDKEAATQYYNAWEKDNAYCYSFTIPLDTMPEKKANKDLVGGLEWVILTDRKTRDFIKKDLSNWLHQLGITVKKEGDTYIIKEQ